MGIKTQGEKNMIMNEQVKAEWTELLLHDLLLENHASMEALENLDSNCKKLEKWVPLYRDLILTRGNVYGYTFESFYQTLDEMVQESGDLDLYRFRVNLDRYVSDPVNNLSEVMIVMLVTIHDTAGIAYDVNA